MSSDDIIVDEEEEEEEGGEPHPQSRYGCSLLD